MENGEKRELCEVIVIGNPSWRVAVLGLVASKICETYKRPAFVWGREGGKEEDDAPIKGSCRSDGSVNIVELMQLESELQERLEIAGIEVMEARIGYLAYAPEIAAAMLKRQQAEAIVAARFKIVEGAVGMVENALHQLQESDEIRMA